MVARKTLLDRLEETSIDRGFPLKYVKVPFPDVYVHFEEPLSRRHPDGRLFFLTGFYAFEESAESAQLIDPSFERIVEICYTYRYSSEALRIGAIALPLLIKPDDSRDLVTILDESSAAGRKDILDGGGTEEDIQDAMFTRESEILAAKILLYTTLKSARMIKRDDRSQLVAAIKGTKGAKRQKRSEKIKTAYDYILIGPEVEAEDNQLEELKRRKVKPHWRIGFFRDQAYGEKYLLRRQVWIAPVLVNANDTGGHPPPRKDYIVE